MSPSLADQIAAGEVVERPASLVKELVENAIDAGASRVDVELEGGGRDLVRVVDDGMGIHAADLELTIRRHATSKLHEASELADVRTLGFRGEALASIAAVARIVVKSRPSETDRGAELSAIPGEPVSVAPVGMPAGTQVAIRGLFAHVPARRKFLRAEATEVGHCCETVLRLALVHPEAHFTLTSGGRALVDLPARDEAERVASVLGRRGPGPYWAFEGEHDGVAIRGFVADPTLGGASRPSVYTIVRRRVVRERSLANIVTQAMGPWLAEGRHCIACLVVEPAGGTVDVNVHPQKAEVRFEQPQLVYAATRRVVADALPSAPWVRDPDGARPSAEGGSPPGRASPSPSYRLSTRALDQDYPAYKDRVRARTDRIDGLAAVGQRKSPAAQDPSPAEANDLDRPEFLTCLPGPVGLFRTDAALLAVDLLRVRSHMVFRRLARELGGGRLAGQGLLTPVVIERSVEDVVLCVDAGSELAALGIDVERFGDDALLVRAVPASLQSCVGQADVADLIDRVLAWLRMHKRDADEGRREALVAIAATRAADPAPRLARRWLAELVSEGVDLEDVPGIRRWQPSALVDPKGES